MPRPGIRVVRGGKVFAVYGRCISTSSSENETDPENQGDSQNNSIHEVNFPVTPALQRQDAMVPCHDNNGLADNTAAENQESDSMDHGFGKNSVTSVENMDTGNGFGVKTGSEEQKKDTESVFNGFEEKPSMDAEKQIANRPNALTKTNTSDATTVSYNPDDDTVFLSDPVIESEFDEEDDDQECGFTSFLEKKKMRRANFLSDSTFDRAIIYAPNNDEDTSPGTGTLRYSGGFFRACWLDNVLPGTKIQMPDYGLDVKKMETTNAVPQVLVREALRKNHPYYNVWLVARVKQGSKTSAVDEIVTFLNDALRSYVGTRDPDDIAAYWIQQQWGREFPRHEDFQMRFFGTYPEQEGVADTIDKWFPKGLRKDGTKASVKYVRFQIPDSRTVIVEQTQQFVYDY